MPYKTWNDCCQEAINQLAAIHTRYIKNARVLERWNVELCQRKTFLRIKNKGKRDLGIEDASGCAKNQYRRQPLKHKRGKENFRQTVRKCFSRQIVKPERVRLFSQ
jgi:hypothetical protein